MPRSPHTPPLHPGIANVWVFRLSRLGAPLDPILSGAEQERAAGFRSEEARRLFVSARTWLRALMGHYLAQAPHEIELVEGEHGKPLLAPQHRPSIHFNLSHTGETVGIALCSSTPVGLDLERAERPGILALTEEILTSKERDHLGRAPSQEQARLALRYWTAKESCLKALGTGLSLAPRTIEVRWNDPASTASFHCENRPELTTALAAHLLPVSEDLIGAFTAAREVTPHLVHAE